MEQQGGTLFHGLCQLPGDPVVKPRIGRVPVQHAVKAEEHVQVSQVGHMVIGTIETIQRILTPGVPVIGSHLLREDALDAVPHEGSFFLLKGGMCQRSLPEAHACGKIGTHEPLAAEAVASGAVIF